MRYVLRIFATCIAVVLNPAITTRLSDRTTANVDVKSNVLGFGTLRTAWTKVSLANMHGSIAVVPQKACESYVSFLNSLPIPSGRAIRARIVFIGIDPVRCMMSSRVLASLDRNARRRTYTHRAEVIKSNPLRRQSLHVGGSIGIVQWITHRLAR